MDNTLKQIFLKRVAELGCTLDDDGSSMFYIDSPKGKVFVGTECHSLGFQYNNAAGQSWKAEQICPSVERDERRLRELYYARLRHLFRSLRLQ